jgi:hypothetical protein
LLKLRLHLLRQRQSLKLWPLLRPRQLLRFRLLLHRLRKHRLLSQLPLYRPRLLFSRARWLCLRPGLGLFTRHRRHHRLQLLRHLDLITQDRMLEFSADGLSSSDLVVRLALGKVDLRLGRRVAGIPISSRTREHLGNFRAVLDLSIRLVLVL